MDWLAPLAWLCSASLGAETPPASQQVVAEKHVSQLDLNCDSYDDGVDWPEVRSMLRAFLAAPAQEHKFLPNLLKIRRIHSDCYIGLCSLGYLSLLFMDRQRRSNALINTLFGSVPLWDQIPLSYWDTINSQWPIFGLLELVSHEVRSHEDESDSFCCDHLDSELDLSFHAIVDRQLDSGAALPVGSSLKYLTESPARCSYGKATAYLSMAQRLLVAGSPRLRHAAKDLMALGEAQLDRCAVGRNLTIAEQMQSKWTFWGVLRRVEAESLIQMTSLQVGRTPPNYTAPRLIPARQLPMHTGSTAPQINVSSPLAEELPMASMNDISAACEDRNVHVAIAGDRRHMEGVIATLQSTVKGTHAPKRLCVHVFCLQNELTGLTAAMRCSFKERLTAANETSDVDFLLDGASVRIHAFGRSDVLSAELAVHSEVLAETGDLNAPHNFIRFHLAKWIPFATRVVYLDTDVVVIGDVCDLHDRPFREESSELVVAAVPRRHLPVSFYLKVFSPKMPIWLPSSAPSFNAGVMVINMQAWKRLDVTSQVRSWAEQNKDRDLWRHGSQPPLLLLLYDRVEWLPEEWNVDGLGHHGDIAAERIRSAKILHWTGPLKPWLGNGLHKELWQPFSVHCWKDYEGQMAQLAAAAAAARKER